MADSIDRNAFFDALRQFIDTKNAHLTHIWPDRVEVHRFARDHDGKLLHDDAGLAYHTVETHWLTSPEDKPDAEPEAHSAIIYVPR